MAQEVGCTETRLFVYGACQDEDDGCHGGGCRADGSDSCPHDDQHWQQDSTGV